MNMTSGFLLAAAAAAFVVGGASAVAIGTLLWARSMGLWPLWGVRSWSARGKRVLISGASSGIGAEFARQYAAEGAKLALLARRRDRLQAVAAECRAAGASEVHVVECDVGDRDACRGAVAAAAGALGGLDAVVLNAGVSMGVLLEDLPEAELPIFEQMMQVNYFGTVWMAYYSLPHLRASGSSSGAPPAKLVAVTSLAGVMPIPFRTGYAGSKYAVHGFLDTLRQEMLLTGTRVDVTCLCPGAVATEINDARLGSRDVVLDMSRAMPVQDAVRRMRDAIARGVRSEWMTPMGKFAAVLRFLAPDLADRFTVRAVRAASTVRSGAAKHP
jgi:short-subunit dehydrogenase